MGALYDDVCRKWFDAADRGIRHWADEHSEEFNLRTSDYARFVARVFDATPPPDNPPSPASTDLNSRIDAEVLICLRLVGRDSRELPPPDLPRRIRELALGMGHPPDYSVPDLTVAHLVGLGRPDFRLRDPGWAGAADAAALVWLEINQSVEHVLSALQRLVIGFDRARTRLDQSTQLTDQLFDRFLSQQTHCTCWTRALKDPAELGIPAETADFEQLNELIRGNALRKATTCHHWHNIGDYEPVRDNGWPIWQFVRKAIKGFTGSKFERHVGGFPSGMLFHLLHQQLGLELVTVAEYQCSECKRFTVSSKQCSSCSAEIDPLRDRMRASSSRLILPPPEGRFQRMSVWKCDTPACAEWMFPAKRCRPCPGLDHPEHDTCPSCGDRHPHGKGRRSRTVYAYQPSPVEHPGPEPADDDSPSFDLNQATSLFAEPCRQAVAQFKGWRHALAMLMYVFFETGDERGIRLVQLNAPMDWEALYKFFCSKYVESDRPNNADSLRSQYYQSIHPELVARLKEHWQTLGLDWSAVENWRTDRST